MNRMSEEKKGNAVIIKTKNDASELIEKMNDGDVFTITLKNRTLFVKKIDGRLVWAKKEANGRYIEVDSSKNYASDLLYTSRTLNTITAG